MLAMHSIDLKFLTRAIFLLYLASLTFAVLAARNPRCILPWAPSDGLNPSSQGVGLFL